MWKPRVTVASVIEQHGKFLLVEEMVRGELKLNQPAGHLEDNESLIDAAIRETLEETAWRFRPEFLLGVYRWRHPESGETYLRFSFTGSIYDFDPNRALDDGIVRTIWVTREEAQARQSQHRSPILMRCIDDYIAGTRFPLSSLTDMI